MNLFVDKPDFVGVLASGLCAVHCAAAPLLFAAQPLIHGALSEAEHHGAGHAHGHGIWGSLDIVFLILSLVAVYFATRASRRTSTKAWLWSGCAVFTGGLLMEQFGMAGWLMYVGSGILIVTHLINFRQCRLPCQPSI